MIGINFSTSSKFKELEHAQLCSTASTRPLRAVQSALGLNMKTVAFISGLLVAGLASADPPPLNCIIGPDQRAFGGTPWLVYGCNDQHSVVVVSAPGSTAAPFYFFFAFTDGMYHLNGEGTGNKAATDAAFAELSKLGNEGIGDLFPDATKAHKK